MSQFEDRFWSSRDGLRLHYRDYPGASADAERPPVLCLPGLTRNARDFANLAERLSPEWRVICPDLRGRGDSAYARDSHTYQPAQYVEDIEALLEETGITRFVAVGTSLGGLMTMMLASGGAARVAGAVLNDIGPVLEPAGLERIFEYVGQGRSFPTWMHAARALQDSRGEAFPRYGISDWLAMAKRVMTLGQNGRIVFDYDMKIAEPFAALAKGEALDLWPAYDALVGRPLLIVRGALSDLFSVATLDEMLRRNAAAEAVTLADIGHAPTLDEPEAVAAIARLLERVG
ncbi:alpha/beta hydrolase [Novosphingobium sp.]|uniref:alpha/beta fold hydrolase n=1 Tax=Novosphingobium sp. TaxID=1874826 RepID=UPI0026297E84|nr:alpha/beta hydrolase [Novosphingobium sp.]